MEKEAIQDAFVRAVETVPRAEDVRALAAKLAASKRKATPEDRIHFASMLAHAAFLAPERVAEIYDAATEGWYGRVINAAQIASTREPPEPAPSGLWEAYWSIVEDATAGKLDALSITQRTAALGEILEEGFAARAISAAHTYPGVTEAAQQSLPDHIKLETLAACPTNSLGRKFHDLIVDNTFDLEVLDRDALGLSDLPKPLDYLNTRILQSHDLWHIVAGYEVTALHEIALSGFQMAQFGHNYSAHFLAVTFGAAATTPAYGFPILMNTVLSAWRHGRETPPLMLIDWENEWTGSPREIRDKFGIIEYDSPYRANLIEKTEPLVKVIHAIIAPFRFLARPFSRA